MRGLLFREFMAFAEERFGTEVTSQLTPGEPQPGWNPAPAYSPQGLLELAERSPGSAARGISGPSRGAHRLEVVYRAPRRLGDLAQGLLRGCADHFGERVAIDRVDVAAPGGQTVRFTLTRA